MSGRRTSSRRIFIGNLPSKMGIRELDHHFSKFGKILAVELRATRQRWTYPQIAFVEYEDIKSAAAAIKDTNLSNFGGSTILVEYAFGNHQLKDGTYDQDGLYTGVSGHGIGRSHYGRRSYYGVHVTGLPIRLEGSGVTAQELREYMKVAGDICFAQVFLYGTAIVEYNTHEDMKKAVKMLNNTNFQPKDGPAVTIWVQEEEEYARLRATRRFMFPGRKVNLEQFENRGGSTMTSLLGPSTSTRARAPPSSSYSQQFYDYQSPRAGPAVPQPSGSLSFSRLAGGMRSYGSTVDDFNTIAAMKRAVEELDREDYSYNEGPPTKIRVGEEYGCVRASDTDMRYERQARSVVPQPEGFGIGSRSTSPVGNPTLPRGHPSYFFPRQFNKSDLLSKEGPPTKIRVGEEYGCVRAGDTDRYERQARSVVPEPEGSGIGSRSTSPVGNPTLPRGHPSFFYTRQFNQSDLLSKEGAPANIRVPEEDAGPGNYTGRFKRPSRPVSPEGSRVRRNRSNSPVAVGHSTSSRGPHSAFYPEPLYNYQSPRAPLSGSYPKPDSLVRVSSATQTRQQEFSNYNDMERAAKREKLEDYGYVYVNPKDTGRSQRESERVGLERSGSRSSSPVAVGYATPPRREAPFYPQEFNDYYHTPPSLPSAVSRSPVTRVRRSPTAAPASEPEPRPDSYYQYDKNHWEILR